MRNIESLLNNKMAIQMKLDGKMYKEIEEETGLSKE